MWTTTTVTNGDVELAATVDGPADGPLVVLAHGFPELAYSWRHQVPVLAAAGYRVVAADGRGYGGSSAPADVGAYDIEHLESDLLALLDDQGREAAVLVGHDWGAMVVWMVAQRRPDRVRGVVGLSVPFMRRGKHRPTDAMRHRFGPPLVDGREPFYMLHFQIPGVADAELGADTGATMAGFLRGGAGPAAPEGWLTDDDLDTYVAAFERTGFTGPLNWYRNLDRNWEAMAPHHGTGVAVPARLVAGAADPVLATTPPARQDGWLKDDRGTVLLDGIGHWVQQEAPAAVNAALLDFLRGLDHPW